MLSDTQLQLFADLSRAAYPLPGPGAETFLPFTHEPAGRTEFTFVRMGEGALRIYKNEYDQQPTEFPLRPRCVNPPEDGLEVSFEEAWDIVTKNGWLDPQPRTDLGQIDAEPRSEEGSQSFNKQGQ